MLDYELCYAISCCKLNCLGSQIDKKDNQFSAIVRINHTSEHIYTVTYGKAGPRGNSAVVSVRDLKR